MFSHYRTATTRKEPVVSLGANLQRGHSRPKCANTKRCVFVCVRGVSVCARARTTTHTHSNVPRGVSLCVHAHTLRCVFVCARTRARTHTHSYSHTHTHTHTPTHTHTHTHTTQGGDNTCKQAARDIPPACCEYMRWVLGR